MNRIFLIADILLMILALTFGVKLYYTFAHKGDPTSIVEIQNPDSGSSGTGKVRPLAFYNPIMDRNLFNTKEGNPKKVEAIKFDNLDKTKLKLKLWGTVYSEGEGRYAVIEDSLKRRQNLYRIGDEIQNATVKMILREKVVLNVRGKDEILEIEKITSGPKRRPKPLKPAPRRPRPKKPNPPPPSVPVEEPQVK